MAQYIKAPLTKAVHHLEFSPLYPHGGREAPVARNCPLTSTQLTQQSPWPRT